MKEIKFDILHGELKPPATTVLCTNSNNVQLCVRHFGSVPLYYVSIDQGIRENPLEFPISQVEFNRLFLEVTTTPNTT